jgi:hypothetical protein
LIKSKQNKSAETWVPAHQELIEGGHRASAAMMTIAMLALAVEGGVGARMLGGMGGGKMGGGGDPFGGGMGMGSMGGMGGMNSVRMGGHRGSRMDPFGGEVSAVVKWVKGQAEEIPSEEWEAG